MLTIYKSLIRCHLEYCCPLWHSNNMGEIMEIESVQRPFTSKIQSVKNLTYWERLAKLDLMSLQRRRERYLLFYMWKILNNIGPNDLKIEFTFNNRTGFKAHFHNPPRRICSQAIHTKYQNSFSSMGPRLWNTLPFKVNTTSEVMKFKMKLDKFIKSLPDMPPVPGYVTPNNNSIVSWTSTSMDGRSSGMMVQ